MVSTHNKDGAFARWLRTGMVPRVRSPDGVELKFNPWHDPANGRFTFAHTGDYHPRGSRSSDRADAPKTTLPEDEIVVTAKRQTVDDVAALSQEEFDDVERAAKAGRWTSRRENHEIHEYVRLRRIAAARPRRERIGEQDWAQQGKDFARLYAEAAVAEAAGVAAAKYVIAPAIRAASPMARRILRPKAYARELAANKPLPPAPEPVWVDENAAMKDRARRYNDSAPGARSDLVTQRRQAPALYRTLEDGSKRPVRFDGYQDGVFIDRKINIVFKSDAKARAVIQSQVLRENNAVGRWEVPNGKVKKAALRLFKMLDIDNIGVKVVPE